ncbi:Interferon-inducible double-stranded RNA-dependent protein kinase activator A [Intoshia linei]|uniref:Interferon-inducible double-stranded RNA-dependent protein kinase activator A n=1 Tax=Intoshia linei TaxID=1819745 RepID=A0A177AZB7_9BILA|nr:Interferon-inducible double-stranded RNA-dependent protein kinase activator A [Intoshia linei]
MKNPMSNSTKLTFHNELKENIYEKYTGLNNSQLSYIFNENENQMKRNVNLPKNNTLHINNDIAKDSNSIQMCNNKEELIEKLGQYTYLSSKYSKLAHEITQKLIALIKDVPLIPSINDITFSISEHCLDPFHNSFNSNVPNISSNLTYTCNLDNIDAISPVNSDDVYPNSNINLIDDELNSKCNIIDKSYGIVNTDIILPLKKRICIEDNVKHINKRHIFMHKSELDDIDHVAPSKSITNIETRKNNTKIKKTTTRKNKQKDTKRKRKSVPILKSNSDNIKSRLRTSLKKVKNNIVKKVAKKIPRKPKKKSTCSNYEGYNVASSDLSQDMLNDSLFKLSSISINDLPKKTEAYKDADETFNLTDCENPFIEISAYAAKNKFIIEYIEVDRNGAPHAPIFKYHLNCGDMVGVGSGTTKKLAKRNAALSVLNYVNGLTKSIISVNDHAKFICDNNGKILTDNPVGKLNKMCAARLWPFATYDFGMISESPPVFVCSAKLIIDEVKIETCSKSSSKKMAKRKGAEKLYNKIKNNKTISNISYANTEIMQDLTELSDSNDDQCRKRTTSNKDEMFDIQLNGIHCVGKYIQQLQQMEDFTDDDLEDPETNYNCNVMKHENQNCLAKCQQFEILLNNIANEQNLNCEYSFFTSDKAYISIIHIHNEISIAHHGISFISQLQSKEICFRKTLKSLKNIYFCTL